MGWFVKSSPAVPLNSRTTTDYIEELYIFIDPIPEKSTFGKLKIINQRLSDLEAKTVEICGRIKLAKAAYARRGSLTTVQIEMFDRRINSVSQTCKTIKAVLYVWLDEACERFIEENPIENLEAGIIRAPMISPTYPNIAGAHLSRPTRERTQPKRSTITTSRTEEQFGGETDRGDIQKATNIAPGDSTNIEQRHPADINTPDDTSVETLETIIESSIYPHMSGTQITSTLEERTQIKRSNITTSRTEERFVEETNRGNPQKNTVIPPAGDSIKREQRLPADINKSEEHTVYEILENYGMIGRATRGHPNYRMLTELETQVYNLHVKCQQIQPCGQSTPKSESDAHTISGKRLQDIRAKIAATVEEWITLIVTGRTLNIPMTVSEQFREISSSNDNWLKGNTCLRKSNIARVVPTTSHDSPQLNSTFAPEFMETTTSTQTRPFVGPLLLDNKAQPGCFYVEEEPIEVHLNVFETRKISETGVKSSRPMSVTPQQGDIS